MVSISRICCKIVFQSADTEFSESIVGEIDRKQLISSDSNWITVHNAKITSRGLKSTFCVVPKSEIREIIVLKPIKRLVFTKVNLVLNNTIETN